MITQDDLKKETAEIAQFIQYSVEEGDREQALSFLEKHKKDPVILTLLREFYSKSEYMEFSILLVSQGFHRINTGGFIRLITYCNKCN